MCDYDPLDMLNLLYEQLMDVQSKGLERSKVDVEYRKTLIYACAKIARDCAIPNNNIGHTYVDISKWL